MTKHHIFIALVIFIALLLYTGGSYLVVTRKFARPTPTPSITPPIIETSRIEITNSPFSKITKQEVESLAESGGIKKITMIYNPPTQEVKNRMAEEASKAGQPAPKILEGPVKTRAVAGYFKEIKENTLIITQKDGKEYTLAITDSTRLWIKTAEKLEIVSTFLSNLTNTAQFFSTDELVLAANLSQETQPIQARTVILFP